MGGERNPSLANWSLNSLCESQACGIFTRVLWWAQKHMAQQQACRLPTRRSDDSRKTKTMSFNSPAWWSSVTRTPNSRGKTEDTHVKERNNTLKVVNTIKSTRTHTHTHTPPHPSTPLCARLYGCSRGHVFITNTRAMTVKLTAQTCNRTFHPLSWPVIQRLQAQTLHSNRIECFVMFQHLYIQNTFKMKTPRGQFCRHRLN